MGAAISIGKPQGAKDGFCPLFLQQYAVSGHRFLKFIVSGQETWFNHYTPEMKCASMEWKYPGSLQSKKFKVVKSAGKVMATMFWDHKGVFLAEFMQQGTTIITGALCIALLWLTADAE
jgi:hypothetical protein